MEDKLELSCLANMSMIQVHVLYLPLKKKKLERKLNENWNVDPIVCFISERFERFLGFSMSNSRLSEKFRG